ncbi:MAG TPA: DUF167 domain-containing protein [Gemmatimonadaceae bacterium]|nr:DUF167 domain-containing protein [Gemmatimonadaceae bacterium]
MSDLIVQRRQHGVRFTVRVQPRSSRNTIDGVHAGALKVRLTAPPVDGAANDALVELLCRHLRVAARSVHIVSGGTSRTKLVDIEGVEPDQVRSLVG